MRNTMRGPYMRADSGGGITVDVSGMTDAIAKLESLQNQFSDTRDSLCRDADSLLAGSWEGEGAEAFEKSFWSIRRYFDDDMESLDTIITNLKTIRDAYLGMDREVAAQIEKQVTGG